MLQSLLQLELHLAARYKLRVFTEAFNGLMLLGVFYFLSEAIGENATFDGRYFPFIVLGLAFRRLFQTFCEGAAGRLMEWRRQGALEAVLVSPHPRWKLLLAAGAADSIQGLGRATLLIVTAVVLFQAEWQGFDVMTLALTLLLTFWFTQAFSLVSIASVLLWKRVNIAQSASALVTLILSGVYFPVSLLPEPARNLSLAIPFTHAMNLFRTAFGASAAGISPTLSFGVLGAWCLALSLAGALFFRYAEKRILLHSSFSGF